MALTAKGRATRQRIIEGASAHMRTDAPGTVTLDDIRASTGTSKGQLFHYFPGGKEEILLAVARHEAERVIADQRPHIDALNSWTAWTRWRDAVVARYRAHGAHCPLGNLMNQVGSTPGAAEVTGSLLDRWQLLIRQGVTTMQSEGLIDSGLDADRAAAAFIAGIQGGVQMLRSTGDSTYLEVVLDILIDHLRGRSVQER
ncbi:TetR/AcrR family transcriptional regulator [Streptomyces kunmingensis]|uniref:TetR/AcrR family transcriptional regulator n=1 Tax=Streptomyces kunmingensis TaxID=68225 RepID=A0ABU6C7G3_9ACTN|nr:TetR/AcrR family transcriptional regulator [Streptomyces kunmingensis]MEB3960538.1 TetR/AcrR family transcriptional regulator [Streptomyces kunmingensis]